MDHLEIYFSGMRARFGANNNPSAYQFKFAYKRLLVRSQIQGSKFRNCVDLDNIEILTCNYKGSEKESIVDDPIQDASYFDHDYLSTAFSLSPFVEDVIAYIAGFVCKKIIPSISCEICESALLSPTAIYGKMFKASHDVIHICKICKRVFRNHEMNISSIKNVVEFFRIKIFRQVYLKNFVDLEFVAHASNNNLFHDHKTQLGNLIIQFYLKIRIFKYCRDENQKELSVCSQYNKLVLFKNQ